MLLLNIYPNKTKTYVRTKTCAQMSNKNTAKNSDVLQWVRQTVVPPCHGHYAATDTRG